MTEAVSNGARKTEACKLLGISIRTLQRWEGGAWTDSRKGAPKSVPRKLSENERQKVIDTACEQRFKNLNPHEIVALLAEEGQYIASERTFYRILKEEKLLAHRENSRPRKKMEKPEELKATRPNQVWSWDITYMKTAVRGLYFYLYLFLDVWSRKIVGWEVHVYESAEISSSIMRRLEEENNLEGINLHADNGGPMKGATMLSTLHDLGVIPSFSRPRVSDDNPYSESLFKTLKYTAGYPNQFKTIEQAREWVSGFVHWYNNEHRHSQIQYVTPEQRHSGKDIEILEKRKETYRLAQGRNPHRWSKKSRNWEHENVVYLNPRFSPVEAEKAS